MAVLDSDANEIVIRVVYDGPPEAGKTTSLRALAGSLDQSTVTPEEDADGHTLWFDWMEYTGGRFAGCRIRCQIVSVPGQAALFQRRRLLLDAADAVVFVGDSTAASLDHTMEFLFDLREILAELPGPPVGVLLQANKRDAVDAVEVDQIRARLAEEQCLVGVVESVATEGTGIREAFVYAVRLALDRVRELMDQGALPAGKPSQESPDDLLRLLHARQATLAAAGRPALVESTEDSVAAQILRELIASEEAARHRASYVVPGPDGARAPHPPDSAVPSGAIWPPVEGRAILHEIAQLALVPRRLSSGDWAAGLGSGWRIVSGRDAVHAELDQGRAALIQWARLHALSLPIISHRRCIVLADTGDGAWRLWQIVRAEDSLRELMGNAVREHEAEQVLYRLCQAAQLLLDADGKLARAPCALPCSIDTIGPSESAAVYIGLMPDAGQVPPGSGADRAGPAAFLRSQLEPLVRFDLADRCRDLRRVLHRIPRQFLHSETILTTLDSLLESPQ